MSELQRALKPVVSFRLVNTDNSNEKKICLLPGHFNTQSIVTGTGALSQAFVKLSYADPASVVAAGYACDQVADNYDVDVASTKNYPITVIPGSPRCRYRDFLDYINRVGARITQIRLTNNKTGGAGRDQFDKEFQVSASAIGTTAASDYINLASCKNPANYDQDMIIVDLAQQNLMMDATTLLLLTVAPGADFTIEFTLSK
ncbi:MAG: hypothetical protein II817_00565 [Bacteroidales bacterium]|nr:hypothetical protein [Bacteroidales bacterium]